MMNGLGSLVQQDEHQGVAVGIDSRQRLRTERGDDVVAPLDEARALLAHVVVLHLGIGLVGKTAADGTPLVVSLFHILPVNPRLRLYVAHIVDESLGQAEVAADAIAAGAGLAHPQGLSGLMGQQGQTGAVGIAGLIGVRVPLAHQRQDAGAFVFLETLYGQPYVGLVGGRDDGAKS